jgi:hypothetical protein
MKFQDATRASFGGTKGLRLGKSAVHACPHSWLSIRELENLVNRPPGRPRPYL